MICNKCGSSIPEGMKFCGMCGYSAEKTNHKQNGGINLVVVLFFVISFAMLILATFNILPSIDLFEKTKSSGDDEHLEKNMEGEGFESPEQAAEAYINALNSGDIDEVISTFAMESYVDNFDTRAHIERYYSFSPYAALINTYELSDGSDFDREMRLESRKAQILHNFESMVCQRTVNHMWQTVGPLEGSDLDDFMSMMKENDFLNKWKNMSFIEFVDPGDMSEEYEDENSMRRMQAYRKLYNCEEIQDVCAIVEVDGEKYYQCLECVRYDDKWFIAETGGLLSEILRVDVESRGLFKPSEIDN